MGKTKPRQAEEAYCFSSEPKHGLYLIPNNQAGVFSGDKLSFGSRDTHSSAIYCFLGATGQRNEGATEPLCQNNTRGLLSQGAFLGILCRFQGFSLFCIKKPKYLESFLAVP